MSLNDRCAESHAVLHYGGTIPDVPEVRDRPDNAAIWERIRTGELPALYDERWTDQEDQ